MPGFLSRTPGRILSFAVLGLGAGVLAGVLWWSVVDLPSYLIQPDSTATMGERDLSEFIAGDAWFCVLGLLIGAALGTVAWRNLRALGWPLVIVVAMVALVAAMLCWGVGYQLGPGEFDRRLATAKPGSVVPIDLTVRAYASLLVWPFFAVIPVLLGSSLSEDEEDHQPLTIRWPRSLRLSRAADQ